MVDETTVVEPPFPIQVEEPKKEVVPPPPATPSVPLIDQPVAFIKKPFWQQYLPVLIGLGILLLLFLLVTKLILPKLQKTKTPASVTLKYWGLWEPENLMAEVISDYQKIKPNVTIKYLRQ